MIHSLKPYPAYKDSDLAWLGEIPAHWEVRRAKYLFREVDERSDTGKEELLSVSHTTGVTPRSQKNVTMFMAESYAGHKMCRAGDLVINTMWAWMAALGVAKQVGIVSPSYAVYRPLQPSALVPDFVDHLLRTRAYQSEYISRSTGIRPSRLRLYPEKFLDMRIVCPPYEEQQRLVAYLRGKDRLIRSYIRAKRRLIELLSEQKQVIIHRAVRRGLDPNVRFKASCIDWLGDVPAHWGVRKLKSLCESVVGGSTPPSNRPECWEGNIVWITPQDVSCHSALTSSARRLTATGLSVCSTVLVPPGSVIVTSRAPVGNVAIAEVELCTNQGCKAIVPRTDTFTSGFAFLVLQVLKLELQSLATGTTFTEISTWTLANVKVPVPPPDEQAAIVRGVKAATHSIDEAIDRAQREIDLIREYRTRLIADVVTGKVDVREIAAALPEVGEAEPLEDMSPEDEVEGDGDEPETAEEDAGADD